MLSLFQKVARSVFFGALRQHVGDVFHELAKHKEAKIVEGHLMPDHVHMCISIPPKYADLERGRLPQRQECDSDRPAVWRAATQLYGREFLGTRLFCLHGGFRRSDGSGIYPSSRRRRQTLRSIEASDVTPPPWAAPVFRVPLRRSPNKPLALPGSFNFYHFF